MSREIRRVPVDWQHPTEPNPHWKPQAEWRLRNKGTLSRLHIPQVRFRALHGLSYRDSLAEFEANPDDYMPDFGDQDLGWCLYQTVSEGSPITPVFATAEALIDHLCTEGDDWDQTPWRREAAEKLVGLGFSMASFVFKGGQIFDGARDIDRIGGMS